MVSGSECKIHRNEIDHLHQVTGDHESRLRELEKQVWRMTAIVGCVSALASALGSIVPQLLGVK